MTAPTESAGAILRNVPQIKVGIVGDYSEHPTKIATTDALFHAADAVGLEVGVDWIATDTIESADRRLLSFHGLFIAPGSPYRSMEGALRAIRFARENNVPLIGTCGGFQHVVIEYARNVLGISDADHAEYDPNSSCLVVTPLECSLAGRRASVTLEAGSRVAALHGVGEVEEEYRCTFGLNPQYRGALEEAGLKISGRDAEDEPRVVELPRRRFFVATLYVPQLSSRAEEPHPLVTGFIEACAKATLSESPLPSEGRGPGG